MNSMLQLIMIFIGGIIVGFSSKSGWWAILSMFGCILIMGSYYV